MELKAIHTIYRKPGKEELCHTVNTTFDCDEKEAAELLRIGAAVEVVSEAPAKPAKKTTKKPTAAEKKAAAEAEAAAKKAAEDEAAAKKAAEESGSDGGEGDDEDLKV